MGKSKSAIPEGWLPISAMGRPIPETVFYPFKCPLKDNTCNRLKARDRFTPAILMEREPRVKLIVDLTNTKKYYQQNEFTSKGVDHIKISCPGHTLPHPRQMFQFFQAVDNFIKDKSNKGNYVGVHCTHGVNRTGFFICTYLIQKMGYAAQDAMKAFENSRGHRIERVVYRQELLNPMVNYSGEKNRRRNTSRDYLIDHNIPSLLNQSMEPPTGDLFPYGKTTPEKMFHSDFTLPPNRYSDLSNNYDSHNMFRSDQFSAHQNIPVHQYEYPSKSITPDEFSSRLNISRPELIHQNIPARSSHINLPSTSAEDFVSHSHRSSDQLITPSDRFISRPSRSPDAFIPAPNIFPERSHPSFRSNILPDRFESSHRYSDRSSHPSFRSNILPDRFKSSHKYSDRSSGYDDRLPTSISTHFENSFERYLPQQDSAQKYQEGRYPTHTIISSAHSPISSTLYPLAEDIPPHQNIYREEYLQRQDVNKNSTQRERPESYSFVSKNGDIYSRETFSPDIHQRMSDNRSRTNISSDSSSLVKDRFSAHRNQPREMFHHEKQSERYFYNKSIPERNPSTSQFPIERPSVDIPRPSVSSDTYFSSSRPVSDQSRSSKNYIPLSAHRKNDDKGSFKHVHKEENPEVYFYEDRVGTVNNRPANKGNKRVANKRIANKRFANKRVANKTVANKRKHNSGNNKTKKVKETWKKGNKK